MPKKYYAVRQGRSQGIFFTWDQCKAQVHGVAGAVYKSFPTLEEAEAFLQRGAEGVPQAAPQKGGGKEQELPSDAQGAVAYVDGSYHSQTQEFSSGVVLFYQGEKISLSEKFSDPALAVMHNVAGEIMGAVLAIRYCQEREIPGLTIYHDYEGVGRWAQGDWKANKPGTQWYAAFCQAARETLRLAFVKVKGHSGDQYNEEADQLAKQALGI